MARVNEESHNSTCHPHVNSQVEQTIPAFTPQPQSGIALWPALIFHPTESRSSLDPSGWLQTKAVYPLANGHPFHY